MDEDGDYGTMEKKCNEFFGYHALVLRAAFNSTHIAFLETARTLLVISFER